MRNSQAMAKANHWNKCINCSNDYIKQTVFKTDLLWLLYLYFKESDNCHGLANSTYVRIELQLRSKRIRK